MGITDSAWHVTPTNHTQTTTTTTTTTGPHAPHGRRGNGADRLLQHPGGQVRMRVSLTFCISLIGWGWTVDPTRACVHTQSINQTSLTCTYHIPPTHTHKTKPSPIQQPPPHPHTHINKTQNIPTHYPTPNNSYASSAWSKKHLYPYVQPEHLASEYRTLLTLRELVSYGPPDVVCLQEVSWKRRDRKEGWVE